MTIRYETSQVTPAQAAAWLEKCNHLNRPIRWYKVEEYAQMMRDNQWRLNGQGWSFDTDGILVDGQHRAHAVVKSGVTIETLITYGLSPGIRPTVDEGIKRRFQDDLAMAGVANVHVNAALARKVYLFTHRHGLATLSYQRVPRPELTAAWPSFANQVTETSKAASRWYTRWPGNWGAANFMYWLLTFYDQSNPDMVERFFQTVAIGSQNPEDQPLIQLRDKLASQGTYRNENTGTRKKSDNKGAEFDVYWMIKAWNVWLRGGRMGKLQLPSGGLTDPYPARQIAYNPAARRA